LAGNALFAEQANFHRKGREGRKEKAKPENAEEAEAAEDFLGL